MLDKHESVRGVQYLSIKYSGRLAEAGIDPSVGSVGDSYDNALAETINGLYKAEAIHRRGPWRSFEAVEYATLEWVDWFNNQRLLGPNGNIPPAEAEANHYLPPARTSIWLHDPNVTASGKAGAVHIDKNPARGIRLNRRPALTRFLSREEISRLYRVLDAHGQTVSNRQQADIIRLLLLTGCRRSEIVRRTTDPPKRLPSRFVPAS